MDALELLHHNLITGGSYLTANAADPETTGEILYDNIVALAEAITPGFTDEDLEDAIDLCSNGTLAAAGYDPYLASFGAEAAARFVEARAKARSDAAATLGSMTSKRKADAARIDGRKSAEEGKKGGRPRKTPKPE